MKKFIEQYKKASEKGFMLLFEQLDSENGRWLVTQNKKWLYWPKTTLIKQF